MISVLQVKLRRYREQLTEVQKQHDLQNAPVQRLVSGKSGILLSRTPNTVHRFPVVDDAACDVRRRGHVFCHANNKTAYTNVTLWYDIRDLTCIWKPTEASFVYTQQHDMQVFRVRELAPLSPCKGRSISYHDDDDDDDQKLTNRQLRPYRTTPEQKFSEWPQQNIIKSSAEKQTKTQKSV